MGNLISISTAPVTGLIDRPYYDLFSTLEVMKRLWQESVVHGFEFQNLAEWDCENPPRDDDERGNRRVAWQESAKYTVAEIATAIRASGFPVLSVHANRDVGLCLCSDREQDVAQGRRLIDESLCLAEEVGALACVFHLWDTWAADLDLAQLKSTFQEIAVAYPSVEAAVENVPTQLPGRTPFDLVREFEWITLDLRWAAVYDELDRFEPVVNRVANVHLRGRLENGRWVLDDAPFGFYKALDTIKHRWGYSGILTVEPSVPRDSSWNSLIAALSSLRMR
jgi:hypothetical protein